MYKLWSLICIVIFKINDFCDGYEVSVILCFVYVRLVGLLGIGLLIFCEVVLRLSVIIEFFWSVVEVWWVLCLLWKIV